MIIGGDLKVKLFSLAKKLGGMPRDAEYAIVVYEDGHISPIISQRMFSGAMIPFSVAGHGVAVAVLHTHPVPRTAPSLTDLNILFNMAIYNVPVYLGTIHRGEDEITLTLYIARRPINPEEARKVLRESYIYELLNVREGFKKEVSDKQIYEQHKMLQKLNISIERYRFKIK